LSLIAGQQNSNYKCQVYFDPKKELECNSVRQFNEYVNHYDADLCRIRRFQTLGSVLSPEKLGQTFFAVIMTKTPLLMGFLVYELNCPIKKQGLVILLSKKCMSK
jgi:hypothetical protein